jgi:hypothetical protein
MCVTSIRIKKTAALLLTFIVLLSASGATCQRPFMTNPFASQGPAAPQVLPEGATRDQIIAAVNQNSSRIRSLTATGVTISMADTLGLPLLSGNIAAERPGRFRLTAGTLAGQEIDLGSNDELFWLWVKRNQPPAVYYCRHSQFAQSNIRQVMPVEPSWLLAALGMVDLEPASVVEGPLPSARGNGTVELRSWMPSASGTLQKVMVIDARRAWVLEQDIYDQAGSNLLASARTDYRYDWVNQISLPQRVSIQLPSANLKMTINLGTVQINQLAADRQQLWTLPTFEGYQQFDLGGAAAGTPLPGQAPSRPLLNGIVPASYPAYPTTPYPVAPAASTNPSSGASSAQSNVGPLPLYGERQTPTPSMRR